MFVQLQLWGFTDLLVLMLYLQFCWLVVIQSYTGIYRPLIRHRQLSCGISPCTVVDGECVHMCTHMYARYYVHNCVSFIVVDSLIYVVERV